VLFNSYYQAVGPQHPRPQRGVLSRPSLAQVLAWREQVDHRVQALIARSGDAAWRTLLQLGLHHEQQHQELLLTDILHALSCNPALPAYHDGRSPPAAAAQPLQWLPVAGGVVALGHDAALDGEFHFDNEGPRHQVLLRDFELASRPVSCGEVREFIADGGYRRAELWLSLGWDWVNARQRRAPLYWHDDGRSSFTLHGLVALDPHAPAAQLSYFEADAFARWAGARLPTDHRGRMGARGAAAAAAAGAAVWQRVAVDAIGLCGLSGLPATCRCGGRIQRQVHVQPVRAARQLVRDAGRPRARQLPQLLCARRAVAVQRGAPGARRLSAAGLALRAWRSGLGAQGAGGLGGGIAAAPHVLASSADSTAEWNSRWYSTHTTPAVAAAIAHGETNHDTAAKAM